MIGHKTTLLFEKGDQEMSQENTIKFTKVKSYLVFDVHGENFDEQTAIEVSCGEDIQNYLEVYRKEKWDELFEGKFPKWSVNYAFFKGFQISGSDSEGNKFWAGNDHLQYGSVTLTLDKLADENASKIKQIRDIIG